MIGELGALRSCLPTLRSFSRPPWRHPLPSLVEHKYLKPVRIFFDNSSLRFSNPDTHHNSLSTRVHQYQPINNHSQLTLKHLFITQVLQSKYSSQLSLTHVSINQLLQSQYSSQITLTHVSIATSSSPSLEFSPCLVPRITNFSSPMALTPSLGLGKYSDKCHR